MKKKQKILICLAVILVIGWGQTGEIKAQQETEQGSFFLQTSLLTHHWHPAPDHNNNQKLIGMEYHKPNSIVLGGLHFKNSYFQPCWYVYTGKIYDLKKIGNFKISGKLTYGIITGYDDENGRHRAYLNRLGTFGAIVPTLSVNYKDLSLEFSLFANAGYIINAGVKF